VNQLLLNTLPPSDVNVIIRQADEAEVDEMWSYVGKKTGQRWLWHAIDHHTALSLRIGEISGARAFSPYHTITCEGSHQTNNK
jgi:IS1 transposase